MLNKYSIVLDMGCGTGRWTKFIVNNVKFVEAIDPSKAVISAAGLLKDEKNVRISKASVSNIPFADESFDFVFSLGVLHHVPDTQLGMQQTVNKLKKGGFFLVYLYYNLDNRGPFFKILYQLSNFFRKGISKLPSEVKRIICDFIAITVYMPLVLVIKLLLFFNLKNLATKIPLYYYANKSLNIIRNDALDRFGTPLEHRFSKLEIRKMMENCGLTDIMFSNNEPYWHAIGKKRMKKKILVICPYPEGIAAGQRLKYEQYFTFWQEKGYSITVKPFMSIKMWNIVHKKGHFFSKTFGTLKGIVNRILQIFLLKKFDAVYIFMYVSPIGFSFFEKIYRKFAKNIIFDLEDNRFLGSNNESKGFAQIIRNKNKTEFLVKTADYVISSSPALNEICLKINLLKNCAYISSSINTNKFVPKNNFLNDHKIVIGWTGTYSTKPYLDLLRPAFIELKKHKDFKLLVIGKFEYDFPEMDLEYITWNKKSEVKDLQKIDIGVYPLPLEEWVMGKSGLKTIQYLSIGIPSVSTDISTVQQFIINRENGFLVKTNEEWVSILSELIDNANLRKQVGEKARETALSLFSKDVIQNKYLEILEDLLKNKK